MANRYRFTDQELNDLYTIQNLSMTTIAKTFGCTVAAISYRIKKACIPSRQPQKGLSSIEVMKLYKSGLRQKEIAKIFNCTRSAVQGIMRRHNIIADNWRYRRLHDAPENYDTLYVSPQWTATKRIVFKNLPNECDMCHIKENLIVHHIVPRSCRPELFFDLDNLQILCTGCHHFMHQGIHYVI